MLKLRINGAVSLLPVCAFVAPTVITVILLRSTYCLVCETKTPQRMNLLPPSGERVWRSLFTRGNTERSSLKSIGSFGLLRKVPPPNFYLEYLRSQWPRGLTRSPAETVGSNPMGAWMSVCCEWCVLSGRGLCDEPITGPE